MTFHETDSLMALIANKQECLTQLCELGARQLELIDEGGLTQLLKVLSAKQHVIGALQGIEKDLKPFGNQDPSGRQWRSPKDRTHCAEQAAACKRLLSEIVRQEKESENQLKKRRDAVAVQLHDAHAAGKARGAYFAESDLKTGMLDVTSDSGEKS